MGPRFSFRRSGRFVPFVHVLLGLGHITGSIQETSAFILPGTLISSPSITLLPQDFTESNTALAVAPGLGVDMNVSPRLAIHLFQLDYMMTRFYNQRQDNGRVSAGIMFQFGRK